MTIRALLLVVAVAMIATVPTVASAAAPSDTGVSLASFNESEGCPPGIPGPIKADAGTNHILVGSVIHGPWGDFFGRTQTQVYNSLKTWRIATSSKYVRIHERAWPAAQLVDARLIAAANAGKYYQLISAGSWFWRTVGGTNRFSEHAIGTAIDLNPQQNPYSSANYLRTNMPSWWVDSFVDSGWCWGGQWVNVKDCDALLVERTRPDTGLSGPSCAVPAAHEPRAVQPHRVLRTVGTRCQSTGRSTAWPTSPATAPPTSTGSGRTEIGSRLEAAGSQSGFTVIGYRKNLPVHRRLADPRRRPRQERPTRPVGRRRLRADREAHRLALRRQLHHPHRAHHRRPGVGGLLDHDARRRLDPRPRHHHPQRRDRRPGCGADRRATPANTATYAPGVGDTSNGWSLLLGDWDVNGITDLYALPDGTDTTVRIATQSGGLADVPTTLDVGGRRRSPHLRLRRRRARRPALPQRHHVLGLARRDERLRVAVELVHPRQADPVGRRARMPRPRTVRPDRLRR